MKKLIGGPRGGAWSGGRCASPGVQPRLKFQRKRLRLHLGLGIVTALIGLLMAAPAAHGYSAQITRAEANSTWTRGSSAGSITWTDCGAACNWWLPYATVQPSLPSYSCRGDELFDSDPNTQQIWSGGQQTANATLSFDRTDVGILQGVVGQRVCLSVIQSPHILDPICVAQAPILDMDPNACPFVDPYESYWWGYTVAASKLLSLAGSSPGTPSSPAPGTSQATTCKGAKATIVGTNGNDVRKGTAGKDVMVGLGGNDKLSGLAGNDLICAGAGKDTLNGGKGNDKLYGEAGKDTLKGGAGKDKQVQ